MSGHKTEGAFGDAVVKQTAALNCANQKIETIDQILDDAEAKNGSR